MFFILGNISLMFVTLALFIATIRLGRPVETPSPDKG
jgi:hypothetical protein